MVEKWNLVVDVEECINCYNCTLAIQDEYAEAGHAGYSAPMPKHGHRWIDIIRVERGRFPILDVSFVPTMCNHCDNAPCTEAAENGAVKKRSDGIVVINPDKARGQKQLVDACPYGAIWWNEDEQVPQHWNFDAHLIDEGWREPRCVNVCPTGALKSMKVSETEMAEIVVAEDLEVLKPEIGAKPRVYYKNFHPYNKVFVAGSIARTANGREECASDVAVILTKSGSKLAEVNTDKFGDFKFDGLEKGSGEYQLQIHQENRAVATKEIELGESMVLELTI